METQQSRGPKFSAHSGVASSHRLPVQERWASSNSGGRARRSWEAACHRGLVHVREKAPLRENNMTNAARLQQRRRGPKKPERKLENNEEMDVTLYCLATGLGGNPKSPSYRSQSPAFRNAHWQKERKKKKGPVPTATFPTLRLILYIYTSLVTVSPPLTFLISVDVLWLLLFWTRSRGLLTAQISMEFSTFMSFQDGSSGLFSGICTGFFFLLLQLRLGR